MSRLLSVLSLNSRASRSRFQYLWEAVVLLYTYLPCEVHTLKRVAWQRATCCVVNSRSKSNARKPRAHCVVWHLHRKTVYKSYVCDFSSTVLSNLLTPQRGYWIECNTTQVRPRSS